MAASAESRFGANFLVLIVVLGTSILGLMAIYDHDYSVAVLDTSLNTVIARTDKEMATSFAAEGVHKDDAGAIAAYTCLTAGTPADCPLSENTKTPLPNAGQATALESNLKAVLDARIKREYQLKSSGLVWQGEEGDDGKRPELHEPKNTIDFQFDNLNDGWSGCETPADGVFTPFHGTSPKDTDLSGRCANDEVQRGDSRDKCKESWLYMLYSTDKREGPMGIEIDDKWVDKVCEYQKDTWKITAGVLIASIALQFLYYVYWAIYTGMGSEDTIDNGKLTFMKIVAGLLVLSLLITIGLFATSRHKLLSGDYKNGLHDATTVVMDDDITIANFPARAKMYKDAFKLCYGDTAPVVAADADAANQPTIGCAAFADFKAAIENLGLDDAGKCAFDDDVSSTFENPEDACNLPKSFADYKSIQKDGPEFTIIDKREFDISSTERSLSIIGIDREGRFVHGIIIAGLVLWLLKELAVFYELMDRRFQAMLVLFPCLSNCLGDETFAIAGGYAGAV